MRFGLNETQQGVSIVRAEYTVKSLKLKTTTAPVLQKKKGYGLG